jgi:lysophospholipase L1-like esterase
MTNRSRALRAAVASLALLAPAFLGASTASAAAPADVEYDALGDSYASGYVGSDTDCGRSEAAYAVQLEGRMRIDLDGFVACAGATTTSLVSGGQLEALDEDTDLVTVSVGGNDIGWSTALTACLGGSDLQCSGALAGSVSKINGQLAGLLDPVYSQIAEQAPGAHVVVTGYPRLFSPEYGAYLGASVSEQQALNEGADLLNSVIAAAAAEYGFQFVDVTKRFLDHGVNAPESWIVGPGLPGAFHPNADGYQAYTAAVTAAIKPSQLR